MIKSFVSVFSTGSVSKCSLLVTHVPSVNRPYGDHQIKCGGNKDRIHWHDSIRDALFSSAQSAALCPRKEMPSLICPLSVGEECKHSADADACWEVGVSFVPLLVETIDDWSEKASHTITSIGRLLGLDPTPNTPHVKSSNACRSVYGRVILLCDSLAPPPPLLLLMVSSKTWQ